MSRVKYNQLANEIANIIGEYTDEIEEGMEKAKEEVAEKTVQRLKRTSPKRYGKYGKSWGKTKKNKAWIVHNKRPLTHILEKGHAKRGGGRVSGQPHIGPAEEEAIKDYEREVEKVIKG